MIDSKNILEQIKQLVLSREPSAKVFLYGSRAKGTETEQSDWDILILLKKDKISHELEQSIIWPLYDLEFDTGEIISPMIYSEKEWYTKYKVTSLFHNIMHEGQPL